MTRIAAAIAVVGVLIVALVLLFGGGPIGDGSLGDGVPASAETVGP